MTRLSSTLLLALLAVAGIPAGAQAQVCLGNSAESPRLSALTLSTGSVSLPEASLQAIGITHYRGSAFFGLGSSVYNVQYGALTGMPNAGDYDGYAYRGSGRWVFGLPMPATAPDALGACFSVGTKLSAFGYLLQLEALEQGDEDLGAWHFSGGIPVTVDLGYRIDLNESFWVVPFISPGLNPHWGGTLDFRTGEENTEDVFGTGVNFFTVLGAALNHRLFRAALVIESGMVEYGGTRVGLEAGVHW